MTRYWLFARPCFHSCAWRDCWSEAASRQQLGAPVRRLRLKTNRRNYSCELEVRLKETNRRRRWLRDRWRGGSSRSGSAPSTPPTCAVPPPLGTHAWNTTRSSDAQKVVPVRQVWEAGACRSEAAWRGWVQANSSAKKVVQSHAYFIEVHWYNKDLKQEVTDQLSVHVHVFRWTDKDRFLH